ncbi:hypothetical protein PDG61_31730 [Mycolicibacterium sp. BiH015]|uniref:hypothetical protein n=1 Tax=Mycolicibacterium sp. BiH015 TaxID=3018808 RepID=UPI0022E005D2|nr:hypothetical protein [Mycolicibacterium sp. BiH015]MDA2895512.1 hypothetical protein [Mycolicibacterium sp. BiH015]
MHTTRNVADAGTDAAFHLYLTWVDDGGRVSLTLPFPDLAHNERERGRTDYYRFNVSGKGVDTSRSLQIYMTMLNSVDGWLPSSLFVIGRTTAGQFLVLGAHPNWPSDTWFDTNEPNSEAGHLIAYT